MKHNLMADVFNHGKSKMQPKIIAQFRNGEQVVYTKAIFDLLKTDVGIECILDAETGEILFEGEDD